MTAYEHEYPPGEWTAAGIRRALESNPETFPVPTVPERAAWRAMREDDVTGPAVERLVDRADDARGEAVPPLPATLYLRWVEDGTREFLDPLRARAGRLSAFALAECFEHDGRFLDDVLDHAWALCEQAGWSYPVNFDDAELVDGLPVEAPPESRAVDLQSTRTALLLAEIDHVLGDLLHPALRARIRTEVDRRVVRPFEVRDDFRWSAPPANNWNAVCNGRTVTAALYLVEDADRLARITEKGVHDLRHYLSGFDPDGCTAEGIGYWNYGLRNYVRLAAQLEARTGGELDLLSPPVLAEIARFPQRIELSPGRFPAFSDAEERARIAPCLAARLADRFDLPWLLARRGDLLPEAPGGEFYNVLRNLSWCRGEPRPASPPAPPARTFFSGCAWWIARADPGDPDGLAVAAKGGHNDEPHNHNDCGSFLVHRSRESPLADLGAPNYEQYADGRYDALPARSLGHSVPYVNGHEQAAGASSAATVLERAEGAKRDAVVLDLAGCYPEGAGLDALRRSVALDREDGVVLVADDVDFADGAPGSAFESVLVSYHEMDVRDGAVRVEGADGGLAVRPRGDVDADAVTVERLPDAVDARGRDDAEADFLDVWRARVPSDGASGPTVSLAIEPVEP